MDEVTATLRPTYVGLSLVVYSFVSLALSKMSDTRQKLNKFSEKEEKKGREGGKEVGRKIIGCFGIWVVKKLLCHPGTELCVGEEVSLN